MDKSECSMAVVRKSLLRNIMSCWLAFLAFCVQLGWSQGQVIRALGGTHSRRFPLCHRAIPRNLPVAVRHFGKAWSAPAAGNRSARCPLRGLARGRAGIRCGFSRILLWSDFEARHEPGTVAYSRGLQLQLLQETTDEMARNGCKKVIIVNGHGGNEHLLPFFAQSQLEKPHDYVVYVLERVETPPGGPKAKSTGPDWHAGEAETSTMLVAHPELVHQDRAKSESGADLGSAKAAGERLYRNLVVRTLSQSLFGGRFPGHSRIRSIQNDGVD